MTASCETMEARPEGVGSTRRPLTHPLATNEKGAAAMVREPRSTCISPVCDRPVRSFGLCVTHDARLRRMGDARLDVPIRRLNDPQNFWQHVAKSDGCWIWTGNTDWQGYGYGGLPGQRRRLPAYRISYMLTKGPIPAGLELDHLCHTNDPTCEGGITCLHRRCVNPDHLEPVTQAENARRAYPARKTHCVHGHLYDAANTLFNGRKRVCRACRDHRNRSRYSRKSETAR